jgi:hypothetical protein
MEDCTVYRDFQQNTRCWEIARMGMPTTSRFSTVLAKGVGKKESLTRDRYLLDLIAELWWLEPIPDQYRNAYMAAGIAMQPEALEAYQAMHGSLQLDAVAFVRHDRFLSGCSPDGLVGDDGGVEVKTLIRPLMVKLLLDPGVPPEHVAQIQGSMWITGRKWWDLFFYCPGSRPYCVRVDRDDSYISDLQRSVKIFNDELAAKVERLTGETVVTRRRMLDQRLAEQMEEECETESGDGLQHAPEDSSVEA